MFFCGLHTQIYMCGPEEEVYTDLVTSGREMWPGSHCHPEGVNFSLMSFAPPCLYFPLWQETPPFTQTAFLWAGPIERAAV